MSSTHALWVVRMVEEQAHRDDEDRLLRESRAPAACLRPGEIEYKACPYPGSRAGTNLPMNVSALRATSTHWSDITDALAFVRVAYTEQRAQRDGASPPDIMDLWRTSQLGSALPWWYILAHGEVCPAYAANLAKATLGLGIWAQRVFVRTLAGDTLPALTPRAVLELAEANGTLVGDTEVCAGPEKMLLRFFEALVEGVPDTSSPHLARLVAARSSVLAFGAHYLNLKLALWIHHLARRFVYADLIAALGERAELRELLDAACEPPDFFTVGPTDLASLPLPSRLAWFAQLARMLVPCAPDGGDAALCATAIEIARAVALPVPPPALADELVVRHGITSAAAQVAAHALAVFARLDVILGNIVALTEAGFRRSVGIGAPEGPIDAATRDRLLATPARAVIAALTPGGLPTPA